MATNANGAVTRWRFVTLICVLVIIVLLAIIISMSLKATSVPIANCDPGINVNLNEPNDPTTFHDLTRKEIMRLTEFLRSQSSLNLVKSSKAMVNNSYIYRAELYLPEKANVIRFLDEGGPPLQRQAIVTIFRGDVDIPRIEEFIVGPLPNPTYMKPVPGRPQFIPFAFRPFSMPDIIQSFDNVEDTIHSEAGKLLMESFGGSLKNCDRKCLAFRFPVPVSSAVSGTDINRRRMWLNMFQFVEFFSLYPVDFAVLIESHYTDVYIRNVWYNGRIYQSLQNLIHGYNNGSIPKMKIPFPNGKGSEYGKVTPRGDPFQEIFQREPIQIEPDGKRYSVKHNHVEYRGWSFDYRMSTSSGPQIYDVRFKGERIVYEMSLQETLVMYSGNKPSQMLVNYFDSWARIGMEIKGLVPGIDCPTHATLIDTMHVSESSDEPLKTYNAFCLFEFNTGSPLRRHHAYSPAHGGFYEGLSKNILVLRSIASIANYDYLFDFIFYQNGAMEVKASSTGYIMTTFPNQEESAYGMKVQDNVHGNIHIHAFNFKVDLDIKGTSNRYETLDIIPHAVHNEYSTNANAMYHMTKLTRNLKQTELQAVYKFNFDHPKYLIFYNEKEKNSYGYPKAYRILTKGMVKQLFAEGQGNEPSASWARYQMAVTKYKETERKSSSMYAFLDTPKPVVQFQNFLDDDESIVDQDLVSWVTLGVHHIPHTEDLPVTSSTGMDVSFYLLPFNYFKEDPAIASKHSVRIDLKNKDNPQEGVVVTRHASQDVSCFPGKNVFFDYIMKYPEKFLYIPNKK